MRDLHRTPEQLPGELVIANVRNPLENPTCTGKPRPTILVRRDAGHWLVMGLTTNPAHRDGTPRLPVPHPHAVGLHSSGYLWCSRLTRISVLDLHHHIGWVDASLLAAVIEHAHLGPADAAALVRTLGQRGLAA